MKSGRYIFLVSGLVTLVSLAAVAFLMLFGPDRIDLSGKSLPELLEGGELLGLLSIPIVLVITAAVLIPFYRTLYPPEIRNGISAPARVLKVWDTGTTINDDPQVGLLLEVLPKYGPSFQAEAKTIVSRLNAGLVQAGVSAEVKYDPRNTKRIQVLTINVENTQTSPAEDAESRLEELLRLRDKRLISEYEYQQKRAEVIKRL